VFLPYSRVSKPVGSHLVVWFIGAENPGFIAIRPAIFSPRLHHFHCFI